MENGQKIVGLEKEEKLLMVLYTGGEENEKKRNFLMFVGTVLIMSGGSKIKTGDEGIKEQRI